MSRTKTLTKKQCEIAHTKKRFRERFGLEINRHDYRDLVTEIQQRGSEGFVGRASHRLSVFVMSFKGCTFKALYDRQRQAIVTVLPVEYEVTVR